MHRLFDVELTCSLSFHGVDGTGIYTSLCFCGWVLGWQIPNTGRKCSRTICRTGKNNHLIILLMIVIFKIDFKNLALSL